MPQDRQRSPPAASKQRHRLNCGRNQSHGRLAFLQAARERHVNVYLLYEYVEEGTSRTRVVQHNKKKPLFSGERSRRQRRTWFQREPLRSPLHQDEVHLGSVVQATRRQTLL